MNTNDFIYQKPSLFIRQRNDLSSSLFNIYDNNDNNNDENMTMIKQTPSSFYNPFIIPSPSSSGSSAMMMQQQFQEEPMMYIPMITTIPQTIPQTSFFIPQPQPTFSSFDQNNQHQQKIGNINQFENEILNHDQKHHHHHNNNNNKQNQEEGGESDDTNNSVVVFSRNGNVVYQKKYQPSLTQSHNGIISKRITTNGGSDDDDEDHHHHTNKRPNESVFTTEELDMEIQEIQDELKKLKKDKKETEENLHIAQKMMDKYKEKIKSYKSNPDLSAHRNKEIINSLNSNVSTQMNNIKEMKNELSKIEDEISYKKKQLENDFREMKKIRDVKQYTFKETKEVKKYIGELKNKLNSFDPYYIELIDQYFKDKSEDEIMAIVHDIDDYILNNPDLSHDELDINKNTLAVIDIKLKLKKMYEILKQEELEIGDLGE